jgi:hypothetical protein
VYEKIKFSLTEIFEKKQEEDEAAVLNQEKKSETFHVATEHSFKEIFGNIAKIKI